jgi:NitT/TauT family transport system ATP-binding protein
MSRIEIANVGRTFGAAGGESFVALRGVDLTIEPGEFVLLLGPSGCGKSTLLRLIAGLDEPTSGDVRIGARKGAAGFDRIGKMFQQPTLLPWLSVIDNVLYPARVKSRATANQKRGKALELLDMVGLTRVSQQLPASLSGGMQQRVAICRSLILDPEVLLMDEPFSALDAMTREDLQFELIRIQTETGKTIVFVTHSIAEALLLSSTIVVMAAGPGRVAEAIRTELPYPRSLDTLHGPRAKELDTRIRGLIHARNH